MFNGSSKILPLKFYDDTGEKQFMENEKVTVVCSQKCSGTPIWRRYMLTIEEAAGYYHIGEGKLRMLVSAHPNEDFYVMNGNRVLIKREKFEHYLDRATVV